MRILPEFPSTQSPSAATLNGPIASYHNILSEYAMLHEFHPHFSITRQKLKTFTKSRVHLQHFEQDIKGIENSGLAAYLLEACKKSLNTTKPYQGTYLAKQILSGVDRRARTVLREFRNPLLKKNR